MKRLYQCLVAVPLVFLGFGMQGAWVTLVFDLSVFSELSQNFYIAGMACMGLVDIAFVLLAPRLCPLYRRRGLIAGIALGSLVGSLCIVLDLQLAQSGVLTLVGTLVTLVSAELGKLVWYEFFGSLNPNRVALVFSVNIIEREALVYFFGALDATRLWPLIVAMPLVSVVWSVDACKRVSQDPLSPLARAATARALVPKGVYPVALVSLAAVVSFWFGTSYWSFAESSALSVALASSLVPIIVLLVSALSPQWLNPDVMYRSVVPLIAVSMIAMLPGLGLDAGVPSALLMTGDVGLTIVLMVVLSSISYRYGVNAVWLNAIQRCTRHFAYVAGWVIYGALVPASSVGLARNLEVALTFAVVLLLLGLLMFGDVRSYQRNAHRKGHCEVDKAVNVLSSAASDLRDGALCSLACEALGEQFGLTGREREIAALMAQKKPNLAIEKELVIAPGTLKAHINHIYTKLGIHRRAEFDAMIEAQKGKMLGPSGECK